MPQCNHIYAEIQIFFYISSSTGTKGALNARRKGAGSYRRGGRAHARCGNCAWGRRSEPDLGCVTQATSRGILDLIWL
ncbi:unnamed protein product [Caretta caretta]